MYVMCISAVSGVVLVATTTFLMAPVSIEYLAGMHFFVYRDGSVAMYSPSTYRLVVVTVWASLFVFLTSLATLLVNEAHTFFSRSSDLDDISRFETDERRMRAAKKTMEAERDVMESAIRHARVAGEYQEIDEIVAHEQTMRGLRKRLGEQ